MTKKELLERIAWIRVREIEDTGKRRAIYWNLIDELGGEGVKEELHDLFDGGNDDLPLDKGRCWYIADFSRLKAFYAVDPEIRGSIVDDMGYTLDHYLNGGYQTDPWCPEVTK